MCHLKFSGKSGASLEELLQKYVVPDAAYNCRGTRVGCLNGTREPVIAKVMDWVTGDDARQICWLYAPAGFGKSAIAQTLAEICVEREILAASFFFKRGAGDRARINGLIPTLSYHLTLSLPETKLAIQTALQNDITILHQSLEDQLNKLLINPISVADKPIRRQNGRMVVIIDALDECDDKHDIAEFIEILLRASRDYRLPFLFLVTGRVDPHIFEKFSPPETHSTTYSLGLHEFDAHPDIRTFLRSRFSKILKEKSRLMREVPQPWPSDSDIDALVEKSSGLFIFASTLIDFVTDGRGAPQAKLESVLKTHNGLDPLYAQVLSAAPRDDPFDAAVGTVMLLREQLSITDLACLLRRPATNFLHALLGIQSILRIPEDNDKPIELIHASLRDFLTDRSRSGEYFINPASRHALIAMLCLEIMNINAENEMAAKGSVALYSCRHWCHHLDAALMEGDGTNDGNSSLHPQLIKYVQNFKAQSLKYWINTILHVRGGDMLVKPLRKMTSRPKVRSGLGYLSPFV
jgi:hypothetical protein